MFRYRFRVNYQTTLTYQLTPHQNAGAFKKQDACQAFTQAKGVIKACQKHTAI